MTANHTKRSLSLAAATIMLAMLGAGTGIAQAATPPVKEVISGYFGREVNLTETTAKAGPALENVCTIASKDTCQPGKVSSEPGGFANPNFIAIDDDPASREYGDVYVVDGNNERVQVLTPGGAFVLMFGWDVNKTEDEAPGAKQAEKNFCTAASKDQCQAGVEGAAAGQLDNIRGVGVDPDSGDVYVTEDVAGPVGSESLGTREQEFTAEGQFVLEIGEEVNETTKGNVCTAEEIKKSGVQCTGPAQHRQIQSEGRKYYAELPTALAVGGPEDLLYVGEEHRVREYEVDGRYKGEISLTSVSSAPESDVSQLALDQETGYLYLVYRHSENRIIGYHFTEPITEEVVFDNTVREFEPAGAQIAQFTIPPRQPKATAEIAAMALDTSGRLAIAENEFIPQTLERFSGSLYDAGTGHLITEFTELKPFGASALTFGLGGELYAASNNEIVAYSPEPVAELSTAPAACAPGSEAGTSLAFDCTLHGEVNPEEVGETRAWFEFGDTSSFGTLTATKEVATGDAPVAVSAEVEGLAPNETFYDRLAGDDHNAPAPELLTSETDSFITPSVPPRIVGEPAASFVKSFSAVMFGELNPENASTEYFFEYGQCPQLAGCSGVLRTGALTSSLYGQIAATLEATGMQPVTVYSYRMVAENENTTKTKCRLAEGTFTTGPAPVPTAASGAARAETGTTTASISGTVDPDGQPATYAFELGGYAGAATQYGTVFSGSRGCGRRPCRRVAAVDRAAAGYDLRVSDRRP